MTFTKPAAEQSERIKGTCTLHLTHSLGTFTLLGLLYKSIPVSVLHFSVV